MISVMVVGKPSELVVVRVEITLLSVGKLSVGGANVEMVLLLDGVGKPELGPGVVDSGIDVVTVPLLDGVGKPELAAGEVVDSGVGVIVS